MSSKTSTKSTGKRKAAPAEGELPPTDPMLIEQIEEGDDNESEPPHEEETHAARKERKKQKKAAAAAAGPKLTLTMHSSSASSSSSAAAAPVSKSDQLQALLAGMSEEEKKELNLLPPPSTALVPAASTGSSTAVVSVGGFTRMNPYVDTILENEGGMSPLEAFKQAYAACTPAMIRAGVVKVKNPDLALALWCKASNLRVSFMELADIMEKHPNHIQVVRTYEKVKDAKGKMVDDKDKPHVNIRLKGDQFFMPDHVRNMYGLTWLSPFCSTAFFKHGPTLETGVEGTNGKMINGNPTEPKSAQYQNKPYTHLVVDDDFNNPIADHFFAVWNRLADTVMTKAMACNENMLQVRKVAEKQLKNKTIAALPSTGEEWVEWMKKNNYFKTLFRMDDSDDSAKGLGVSTSCYRTPFEQKESGKVIWREELKDYKPPTPMFKDQEFNAKTKKAQIHNDIPTFRCRRADEIQEGKSYTGPLIYVGMSHAVITGKHKVAVLAGIGLYEWLLDTPGVTNKQLAYVVLGREDQLKRLQVDDIVPVDPRFGCPMAQPFGEEDASAAAAAASGSVDADGNWTGFAPAAAASAATQPDPDHAGFAN